MDWYKTLPAVGVQRLATFSEKTQQGFNARFDFREKLRKTWTSISERSHPTHRRPWKSPALHPLTLVLAIVIPVALLVTLQLLLLRSQRDNGIMFAPDINELPLSQTFLYQYFPSIVAVVFSIFWAWIDLEVKRLEPYYQLSREEGALGKDSLLLSYPFGFLPFVSVRAFRERHWTVFWASLALVIVTWGLVPIQAGIFSVRDVSRSFTTTFNMSTNFLPADEQPEKMTLRFAQSTYGIIALNETLPAYMTYEYTLPPVAPSSNSIAGVGFEEPGEWIVPTTAYGLDIHCEQAVITMPYGTESYNSSWGCTESSGLSGNYTISNSSKSDLATNKAFQVLYAGYWSTASSLFYLEGACPADRNHTFFAGITRNKLKDADPPHTPTAMFCEPFYFEQPVTATIDAKTKHPIKISPLGEKSQLAARKFNTTWLEKTMNGGSTLTEVRGDLLPGLSVPDWGDRMIDYNVSSQGGIAPMAAMAIILGNRPMDQYLDWEVLADSYQKAWRLLFARAMTDVLSSGNVTIEPVDGSRNATMNALLLETSFTYVVEGLLGIVSIIASVLLYISMTRTIVLPANPKSIASVMALAAENDALLREFAQLDCCSLEELQAVVQGRVYKLVCEDEKISIDRISTMDGAHLGQTEYLPDSTKSIQNPVRPLEFSAWVFIPFVSLFIVLLSSLALLFVKSKPSGLPLASKNKIIENILENYIPTAIATLIEPIWVLLNRLLCLLKPIEQLRNCNAKARDSIDLNYSSLPPQLVVFKALRTGHYILASVCAMALLANLLAVTFAGLFSHQIVDIRGPEVFQPLLQPIFVSINGSAGPNGARDGKVPLKSGAYRGGRGTDQFYVAESNYTRGTPLPPWTDGRAFYVPFKADSQNQTEDERHYEAETVAFSAELLCKEVTLGADLQIDWERGANITIDNGAKRVKCSSDNHGIQPRAGPETGPGTATLCQNGSIALEIMGTLEASGNVSLADQEICSTTFLLGWMRHSDGSCNSTQTIQPTADNSIFVQCQPQLWTGKTSIRVDGIGRLLEKASPLMHVIDVNEAITIFETGPANLIAQANRYLIQETTPSWHNDSFATDSINYFVRRESNTTRLLDPSRSVPSLDEVQAPLSKAYSHLFSIWLGLNRELLLHRTVGEPTRIPGWIMLREERLFLSTALFAISEGILAVYTIVAVTVYLCRPGKYLPRLPTSIASVIGLFAASRAVHDMRGTSLHGSHERERHFDQLNIRYGYGSFVGVDGLLHVGIEKRPFVRSRVRTPNAWPMQ